MNKETLRMQMLSGVITESQYKAKLNEAEEAQALAAAEKIEDSVENKANVDNLSDEEKDQLRDALSKLGITANSSIKDVADKIEDKVEATLSEAEEDSKKKIANVLSTIGGGLLTSHLVPLIPLIIGHMAGIGFTGGLGITLGVSGALIGLAKALGAEEIKESLNEYDDFDTESSPAFFGQLANKLKTFLKNEIDLSGLEIDGVEIPEEEQLNDAVDGMMAILGVVMKGKAYTVGEKDVAPEFVNRFR